MTLPVVIKPHARADIDEAVEWYETHRPGLGLDFAAAVREVLDEIRANPHRYPVVHRNTREGALRQFPYCVYYRVRPDRIDVIAVYHNSRDPSGWQSRR